MTPSIRMVSVPVEPTEAMMRAADAVDWNNEDERGAVINMWQAMLTAAPGREEGGAVLQAFADEVARIAITDDTSGDDAFNALNVVVDYARELSKARPDPDDTSGDLHGRLFRNPALATREEPLAEAGERECGWCDGRKTKQTPSTDFTIPCPYCKGTGKEALRAQPQACEDAQPVESYWFDPRDPEVTDTNPDNILAGYYAAFDVTMIQCGDMAMFGFWFEPADGSDFQYRYFSDRDQADAEALAQEAEIKAFGEPEAYLRRSKTSVGVYLTPGVPEHGVTVTPLYTTPPAPGAEKLRVAVEALEPFVRAAVTASKIAPPGSRWPAALRLNAGGHVSWEDYLRASNALTALQQEVRP